MRYYWTRFLPSYPTVLVYMLQASEYDAGEFLRWFHRTDNFRRVMRRRSLDRTMKAKALLTVLWLLVLCMAAVLLLTAAWTVQSHRYLIGGSASLAILLLTPWLEAYLVLVPLLLGRVLIQAPRERRMLAEAERILRAHPAKKIAIAGSYGKTTAKEVLLAVLSEGLHVAATPGNMNTPIGISRFATTLTGDEEVLIFEFGESHVGDVKELAELTHPDMGIITGANEAHLSTFKTLERTVGTIFELEDYLGDRPLYKNAESALVASRIHKGDARAYDRSGTDGWKVSKAEVSFEGTSFTLKKGARTIAARVGLLGLHNLGVMTAGVAIAESLGLSDVQIERGLSKVRPFEHRMEPRPLHGAWILDDTYNGNSEGVEAGLKLLASLPAKRRIYVTPGLVEQGDKTQEVHEKIGRLVADTADVAVLMRNSVTDHILTGLHAAGFKGKIDIVDDPLAFYANLEHYIVAGDVVLMQNDWTDNYA